MSIIVAYPVKRQLLETGALRRNEFVLHYQPIVALDTREISGFEALIRWQRTPTQLVSPLDFIGVAEETGLIVFIGAWVIREACTTMARWHREFPHGDRLSISISVNVSPRQFAQADFIGQVRDALTQSGIDPTTLRLELTESITIQDADRTIAILQEIRALGVRVSIDDFGTGYSSLSYLHKLPFDTLKIDRSFVNSLNRDSEGRNIIRTILDLAKNVKMDVVAEGTETLDQLEELQTMGCHFGQGFYFSKPVDMATIEGLLCDPGTVPRADVCRSPSPFEVFRHEMRRGCVPHPFLIELSSTFLRPAFSKSMVSLLPLAPIHAPDRGRHAPGGRTARCPAPSKRSMPAAGDWLEERFYSTRQSRRSFARLEVRLLLQVGDSWYRFFQSGGGI